MFDHCAHVVCKLDHDPGTLGFHWTYEWNDKRNLYHILAGGCYVHS